MAKKTLPNGEVVEYPDGWTDEQFNKAMAKKYPNLMPQEPQSLKEKVMRYGVKGPAAGTAKLARNVADLPPAVLNWLADLPPTIGNKVFEAVGADFRMPYAGKKAPGGPAFPFTGITDEEIYEKSGLPPAEQQGTGDFISQLVPDVAGAIAAPELQLGRLGQLLSKAPGLLGKILPKTVSQAGTQTLYGGAVSPEGQKAEGAALSGLFTAPFASLGRAAQVTPSVPLRHAMGLTGGTAGGYLGYELGKAMGLPTPVAVAMGTGMGAGAYRGMASPDAKIAAQLEGVDLNDPKVIERLEAAKRLNVDITPAEAAKDPFLAGEHAKLGRSQQGSKQYYEAAERRIGQEESAINKLLETIYEPGTMDAKVTAGYEKVYPESVPPTIGMKYSGNRTLAKATAKIEKDPELMAAAEKAGITVGEGTNQKLDKTKLGYWDLMKKYLDKEHERVSSHDAPSVDKLKKDSLDTLRKDIIGDLDPLFPEYKNVRSLSERSMARRTIEKAFDKADVSGKQIYKAFESKSKFDELMHHLREVPEAQMMMKDMKMIFEESRKKPTLTTSAGLEATGMKQNRNFVDAAKKLFENIMGDSAQDPAAIEYIYTGKWQERMKDINKISDKQKKIAAFIDLMGDATGAAGREAVQED